MCHRDELFVHLPQFLKGTGVGQKWCGYAGVSVLVFNCPKAFSREAVS